jgi:hypothetical protein
MKMDRGFCIIIFIYYIIMEVQTLADLERENWKTLKELLKENYYVYITIPKNIHPYKLYDGLVNGNMVIANKTVKKERYRIDGFHEISETLRENLLALLNEKDKRFYITVNEHRCGADGELKKLASLKEMPRTNYPSFNALYPLAYYDLEDIPAYSDKPNPMDIEKKANFVKSYADWANEIKAEPIGKSNFPFSSEDYKEAKTRNREHFKKGGKTRHKKTKRIRKRRKSRKSCKK